MALRPIAWALAAVGCLALLVGGSGAYVTGAIEGWPSWALIAGAFGLLGYAVLDRDTVQGTVRSRGFAFGSGAVVLVALALALAIGAYTLARRNDHTFDWTRDRSFSLSEHSVSVGKSVDFDVALTAYFRTGTPAQAGFEDLVDRFVELNPRLKVEYVDPLREPLRAQEADITGDHGTVVMQGPKRTRRLDWEITEDEFVRELLLLSSDVEHRVCWSMGHGEPDPDDEFSPTGLGAARLELEGLNYQVERIHLAQEGVPSGCEVVVVARPTTEWFPYEREALAAFLASGGRAMLLLDPGDAPGFAADLVRYGVAVGNDVVLDLNLKNQLLGVDDPALVVLSAENFGTHPITRNLAAALVLPISRSVKGDPQAQGLAVVDLLRTSPEAWGETDPGGAEPRPDEGVELIGEVPVMAVVEINDPAVLHVASRLPVAAPAPAESPTQEPKPSRPDPDVASDPGRAVPEDFVPSPGGRLVVIGDSDFASNRFLVWGNNRDLFLNTIAWLVEEEDQIGERPSLGETLEISLTGQGMLCLVSIGLVPGGALLLAALTLIRRRYL